MLYIPDRGDVVWVSFSPQAGHEQAGRRPGLVLTPKTYNAKAGLMLVCPITNRAKGYPFEVILPKDLAVSGTILVDQARSLDWQERNAAFICGIPSPTLAEALGKLIALLSVE